MRARLIVIELGPKDMDWAGLTARQREAEAGVFAGVMAAYIRWLAGSGQHPRHWVRRRADAIRSQLAGMAHERTPGIVANLQAGLEKFIEFAKGVGAVS